MKRELSLEPSNPLFKYISGPKLLEKRIIITPYYWPDIDGIACAYPLEQLLKQLSHSNVKAMIYQTPQKEASWILKKLKIELPVLKLDQEEDIILVDVSDPQDIPSFVLLDNVKAIIDHRSYHDLRPFPNACAWIENVGSASTLVAQLYLNFNYKPDLLSATLLYAAIMSNTIKGRAHNTTRADRIIANWLGNLASVNENFIDEMFEAKSSFNDDNIKSFIDNDISSKLHKINDKYTAIGQLEIVDAQKFLLQNRIEIIEALLEIRQERNAERIFLIIIDIRNRGTYFYFTNNNDVLLFKSKIDLKKQDDYYYTNEIFIRKEIISMLLDQSFDQPSPIK